MKRYCRQTYVMKGPAHEVREELLRYIFDESELARRKLVKEVRIIPYSDNWISYVKIRLRLHVRVSVPKPVVMPGFHHFALLGRARGEKSGAEPEIHVTVAPSSGMFTIAADKDVVPMTQEVWDAIGEDFVERNLLFPSDEQKRDEQLRAAYEKLCDLQKAIVDVMDSFIDETLRPTDTWIAERLYEEGKRNPRGNQYSRKWINHNRNKLRDIGFKVDSPHY